MSTPAINPSDHVHPEISPEHFIYEHTFTYVTKGIMRLYDGNKTNVLKSGTAALARKNRLARFKKEKEDGELEKVFVFFDEAFLKAFQQRHKPEIVKYNPEETFLKITPDELLSTFIRSLQPYYRGGGNIDSKFSDVKREELLLILLRNQPELAAIVFDFGRPEKINLEEFMNRNYRFNVTVDQLAFLTGRSLSAFKRDFKDIFSTTPGRWMVRRRLQEAYFLIDKKAQKPSDIFLDLGFETLSHFSFAFKKQFSITPTALASGGQNQRLIV